MNKGRLFFILSKTHQVKIQEGTYIYSNLDADTFTSIAFCNAFHTLALILEMFLPRFMFMNITINSI